MKPVTQPRGQQGGRLACAISVVVALLALAPAASAATDPLAGGSTIVHLDQRFLQKTGKQGVKVLGLSPVTVRFDPGTISLPVSGGGLDPLNGQGSVAHAGEIKFKRGKRTARVGSLVLDTATASLKGVVVGKAVNFASIEGLTASRDGFGVNLALERLRLTGTAAKLLNAKLGFSRKAKKPASARASARRKAVRKPFAGKQTIGSATTVTQPLTVTILPTGKAKLLPDLETTTKLFMAGATVEPIPPAEFELGPPPAVNLPISGGVMAPDGSAGVLQTVGGQKIAKGSVTTITNNLWLDLGLRVATVEMELSGFPGAPGNVGRVPNGVLDLSAASAGSDPSSRTISVGNAILRMTAEGAASLNTLYGTEFKAGDPLGSISFTAQAQ